MKDLKKLRRAAGLTQFALNRKAKVARSKIADVESGRGTFTQAEGLRIKAVLADSIRENITSLDAAIRSESDTEIAGN